MFFIFQQWPKTYPVKLFLLFFVFLVFKVSNLFQSTNTITFFTKSRKHVYFCFCNLQKHCRPNTNSISQRKSEPCWMNVIESIKWMGNYFGTRFWNFLFLRSRPDKNSNVSISFNQSQITNLQFFWLIEVFCIISGLIFPSHQVTILRIFL